MAVDGNFLTEKGPGGMPNWLIGAIGVFIAVLIGVFRKKMAPAATTATNPATTAQQTPPNVFVVPGSTGAPQTTPPPVGRDPSQPPSFGYTVTGQGDTNISGLIASVFKTPQTDTTEYSILAQQILQLNPDRSTWGSSIPKGTVVNLPGSGPRTVQ